MRQRTEVAGGDALFPHLVTLETDTESVTVGCITFAVRDATMEPLPVYWREDARWTEENIDTYTISRELLLELELLGVAQVWVYQPHHGRLFCAPVAAFRGSEAVYLSHPTWGDVARLQRSAWTITLPGDELVVIEPPGEIEREFVLPVGPV